MTLLLIKLEVGYVVSEIRYQIGFDGVVCKGNDVRLLIMVQQAATNAEDIGGLRKTLAFVQSRHSRCNLQYLANFRECKRP